MGEKIRIEDYYPAIEMCDTEGYAAYFAEDIFKQICLDHLMNFIKKREILREDLAKGYAGKIIMEAGQFAEDYRIVIMFDKLKTIWPFVDPETLEGRYFMCMIYDTMAKIADIEYISGAWILKFKWGV